MKIAKIVLVYDIEYLIELEENLHKAVARKQLFLKKNGFRTNDPAYIDYCDEIEHIEERVEKFMKKVP